MRVGVTKISKDGDHQINKTMIFFNSKINRNINNMYHVKKKIRAWGPRVGVTETQGWVVKILRSEIINYESRSFS